MNNFSFRIILILVAGASALAVTKMPYAYYKLLRFVVFIASIGVISILLNRIKNEFLATADCAVFVILPLVFNPLIPFYLHRDTWALWDAAAWQKISQKFHVILLNFTRYTIIK